MIVLVVGFVTFLLLLAGAAWRRIGAFLRERSHKIALGERIFGPRALPIIGNVHQLPTNSKDWPRFIQNLSHQALEANESLFRFWVGSRLVVIPVTGEATKNIAESQCEIKKGPDYELYVEWLGEALLTSFDERWRAQRKLLTPTFHFRHLNGYIDTFNKQSTKFVAELEKSIAKSEDGTSIFLNMYPLMSFFTLDVITGAIMGIDLSVKEREKAEYEKAISDFSILSFIRFTNPLYFIKPIWYASGYGFKIFKSMKILKNMSETVIKRRLSTYEKNCQIQSADDRESANDEELSNKTARTVFLDMLIEMHAEQKMTLEEMQQQVDTFMFAGHDTTAHALSWFIWAMACHVDVQKRLCAEIREHFPVDSAALKNDSGELLIKTIAELNELRYLDLCVKEVLRMFAPVPIFQRILRDDLMIGDKMVPRGATISLCPMALHYSHKSFSDPFVFNPENFLAENVAKRNPYAFIPFSAGPRNCIGQRFALTVIKIFIVHFFGRFSVSAHAPFHSNRPRMETMCVPDLGIPVTIHRR